MTDRLDISVPRNGDFLADFQLCDSAGAAIDLTGHTLQSSARLIAGDGSAIASATLNVVEPTQGRFSMIWHGSDFDAYGEPTRVSRFDFDLTHLYPDGIRLVPIRGTLHLIPESTI